MNRLILYIPHQHISPSGFEYKDRSCPFKKKLLPNVSWLNIPSFPQPGGLELAKLIHQTLYGHEELSVSDNTFVVRDEYLAWVMEGRRPLE
jgi:hypothetical protein